MFALTPRLAEAADKPALYRLLIEQGRALLEGEHDRVARAANLAALIFHALPGLNWCGFYFWNGRELVLGPFQGRPACTRIGWGRGVCGSALAARRSLVVPEVSDFPGHIACDPASRSEVVVPLWRGDAPFGVLDLDSPLPGRFDEEDRIGLEALAKLYLDGVAE
ncbi:MAG: GAF domain-containing protein [Xanthomonadales bacterium]|nr:GAF domain-containing protein [Xanthomonadales bacterium]